MEMVLRDVIARCFLPRRFNRILLLYRSTCCSLRCRPDLWAIRFVDLFLFS
jgi:hypothetical protein